MRQAFAYLFRPYRPLLAAILLMLSFSALLESAGISLFVPLMLILTQEGGRIGGSSFELFAPFLQVLSQYEKEQQVQIVVVLLFGSILLKNAFGYAGRFLSHRLELRTVQDLRVRIFQTYLFSPYHFFLDRKHGRVVNDLFGETATAGQAVATCLGLMANGITALMLYGLLFFISWQVTVAATAVFVLLTIGFQRLSKTSAHFGAVNHNRFRELTSFGTEALLGIRQVKVFSAEERILGKFVELAHEVSRAKIWIRGISISVQPVGEIVAALLLAVFVMVISSTTFTASVVISFVVTFIVVLTRLLPIVGSINRDVILLRAESEAATAIMKLVSVQTESRRQVAARTVVEFERALSFQNVTFAYPGTLDRPVLHGLNVAFHKGKQTAIVGPSGAGKSTIVDLIIRLYEPVGGRILVDGVNIQDYDIAFWRSAIGFVSQDTFIFNASIRENIAFGWPDATENDIMWAAKQADAHEFIERLSAGYDTEVGERGLKLSGGQRQRLAIARAIVRKPNILLFDEATSALDRESERRVQQAIDRISRDRTVIIVAHRLSTIVGADKIIVLHDGRIVEEGTHVVLMERRGVYSNLYKTGMARRNELADNDPQPINIQEEESDTLQNSLPRSLGNQV